MARRAIIARIQGDDYQARWFWLRACDLLEEHTDVEKVVYEENNVKSLDDVVVYYRGGTRDPLGHPRRADFYQVKFHVTQAGALTAEALTKPEFINAKSVSLLQRMFNAFSSLSDPDGHRFFLYTPWVIHPDGVLARVCSNHDGQIVWDLLARGGPRSASGKARRLWKDHLGLSDDGELRALLECIRLHTGPTMEELKRRLNDRLRGVGLKPVPERYLSNPYDDLVKKLLISGKIELIAEELERTCKSEGLWEGGPRQPVNRVALGVRSFVRWAVDLQNRTERLVCFADDFDGRAIKSPDLWHSDIFPRLSEFLSATVQPGRKYLLHLDTHASIAFLAGYLLPSKVGADIAVVQKTLREGQTEWQCDGSGSSDSGKLWEWHEERISGKQNALALGISITHDVSEDVKHYVESHLPEVDKILIASLPRGSSSLSVMDGSHAYGLAQSLVNKVAALRKATPTDTAVHIFAAAPNGLMFLLGRLAQPIRRWALYEYDFDMQALGAYTPSIYYPQPEHRSRDHIARGIVLMEE